MKKKILSGSALLAVAAVAAWNVSINSQKSDTSGLSLANMEALAQEGEKGGVNTIITQEGPEIEVQVNTSTIAYYVCSTIIVNCLGTGSLHCVS
jgi:hypothetical protein